MNEPRAILKILVDADSCPLRVREIIIKAAIKRGVRTLFVAAVQIPLPQSDFVRMIQVEAGENAADKEIIRLAEPGDLIVTRDIPLAAELVKLGLNVINDRGGHYTRENTRTRLSERNFMAELRTLGLESMKDRSFSHKELHAFAATFDRELTETLQPPQTASTDTFSRNGGTLSGN